MALAPAAAVVRDPDWQGISRGHQIAMFWRDQSGSVRSKSSLRLSPMAVAFSSPIASPRQLSADDAVDIWIARWLRIRRKDLLERYGCDPRRLYEIWEEQRFAGSRERAVALFRERYPYLIDRVDYGPHRRLPRTVHPDQLALFE